MSNSKILNISLKVVDILVYLVSRVTADYGYAGQSELTDVNSLDWPACHGPWPMADLPTDH